MQVDTLTNDPDAYLPKIAFSEIALEIPIDFAIVAFANLEHLDFLSINSIENPKFTLIDTITARVTF